MNHAIICNCVSLHDTDTVDIECVIYSSYIEILTLGSLDHVAVFKIRGIAGNIINDVVFDFCSV